MKSLVKALLFLVLIGCVGVGGIALFFLNQYNMLQGKAQADPQTLPLVALNSHDPLPNHHISLTQYTFGEPIIEKYDNVWQGVWIPLQESKTHPPTAVIWTNQIRDKSALRAFLNQTTLESVVANGLPEASLFYVRPTLSLKKALTEPTAEEVEAHEQRTKSAKGKPVAPVTDRPLLTSTADLVLLSEPTVTLPTGSALELQQLLSASSVPFAYVSIIGAVFLAVLCIVLYSLMDRPQKKLRDHKPNPAEYQKMLEDPPLSQHPLSWDLLRQELLKRAGIVLIGGILASVALTYAVLSGNNGYHELAMVCCGIGILIGAVTLYLMFRFARAWVQGVANVDIYADGLTWTRNKKPGMALWEDIAEVYRDQQRFYRNGHQVDTLSWLKLVLYDGQVMYFTADMLADFAILAEHLLSRHGDWVYKQKGEELEAGGMAEFGRDLIVYQEGLSLRGKAYRWNQLQHFQIRGGSLVFQLSRSTVFNAVKFSLDDLPNYLALLKLLEDLPVLLDRSAGGYDKNPLLQHYGS